MELEHRISKEHIKNRIEHTNSTLKNFITHESFGGVLLFFCVAIAMIIANTNFGVFYNEFFGMYFDFHVGGMRVIHHKALLASFLVLPLGRKTTLIHH